MKTATALSDERAELGHKIALLVRRCRFDELGNSTVAVWHVGTTVECQCEAERVTMLVLPPGVMSKQTMSESLLCVP